jgi:hypothetical protein
MKDCANLPAEMRVDFLRVYQDRRSPSSVHSLACSPPAFPTAQFIRDFPDRFRTWDTSARRRRNSEGALTGQGLSGVVVASLLLLLLLLFSVCVFARSQIETLKRTIHHHNENECSDDDGDAEECAADISSRNRVSSSSSREVARVAEQTPLLASREGVRV